MQCAFGVRVVTPLACRCTIARPSAYHPSFIAAPRGGLVYEACVGCACQRTKIAAIFRVGSRQEPDSPAEGIRRGSSHEEGEDTPSSWLQSAGSGDRRG